MTKLGKCPTCGDQEMEVVTEEYFRLGVPSLEALWQVESDYACPTCQGVNHETRFGITDEPLPRRPPSLIPALAHQSRSVYRLPAGRREQRSS